ncbi:peptidase C1 [Sinomonas cellulolyticus]|jgi:C1A family cysteine protease|uniref:C1 family peptidase n=1 Tax=Sinomonas cellulolyticus TaxID=2801916 RepID=A0ABS1JZ75_9MICC|nr:MULTISPECIES: C1 family peptidase [Sinomonas]MBL0704545.1 C1 family peptidase [Sinomonas cellulolyticus]GHG49269.1 peptidase C1 [Sinomonas sp. KCTC 49339]
MTTEPAPRAAHSYGWVPDVPDQRDYLYSVPREVLGALPASVDLTPGCPPVYDQGQLGSCTGNSIAAALEFDADKQGIAGYTTPSRLFIYYNERVMEHTVASDSGAQIRDGVKSVGSQGACPEAEWGYDITKFTVKPPEQCYIDAKQHRAIAYQRVSRSLPQMQGCLADGYPFVFGFTVYESFESQQVAQTGVAPMPGPNEQALGGHAVLAVGYDNASQTFRVRNSWGTGWGQAGYFTLPYQYLLSTGLSSDFWTIRTLS